MKSLAFLKKVPLSGGTFPYRPLWGVAPGGGEVAIDFKVQSASCQVNSNVRNNTEKNIRCNDWNPLRLQVFKNPFLRRLKSFEVYPSVPPSSLFFKSVIFGTAAVEHRHICVVCFVLLISSCVNYISCAVTIVSASCGLSPSFMIMLILNCYIVSLDTLVENA